MHTEMVSEHTWLCSSLAAQCGAGITQTNRPCLNDSVQQLQQLPNYTTQKALRQKCNTYLCLK